MRPTADSPLRKFSSFLFPILSNVVPIFILNVAPGPLIAGQSSTNALPTHAAPVPDVGGAPPAQNAKSFAGTYSDGQLTVTLNGSGNDYTGVIQLGEQKFRLTAWLAGERLDGAFESEGQKYTFTALLEGSALTLTTDGKTYNLRKRGVNPLATAPVNPLAREPQRPPNPLAGSSGPSVAKPVPPGSAEKAAVRFTRFSVRDPAVNNIEAFSLLIPAGWKSEGGMQWLPEFRIQAYPVMKFTDLQTGAGIELLPIQHFVWLHHLIGTWQPGTNYMGDIFWPPITEIPQFIQSYYFAAALRHLQGGRIVTSEDLPKLAVLLAQGNGVPTAKCGRVRYEYQAGNQTWEEDVYVGLIYAQSQLGTNWSALAAYSFRAPKGQLDGLVPVMNTAINTLRYTPEWFGQYAYSQQLFDERMRQGIRDAGAVSAHIARNNEEIRQMFAESYNRSCQAQERMARSYTEYIRGVETYNDPYEDRPVQLPSGYDHVWVNRLGEYILSNQAGFDPNAGSNTEWRQVQKNP